ncbi:MAG: hypothetical protein KAT62_03640 [Desulfuromonadales bacterium]|nr:hypothetical protein [Desulfuromonadales bacterium]
MSEVIQWAVASNKSRSEKANGSRLVNLYAEALPPDSKSNVVIYGTPGTALFVELPTFPILGMWKMAGVQYVVTPTNLYSITSSGTYTDIGTVSLSGYVSMATNGSDLCMVDGVKGYHYSVANGIVEFSGNGWYPANTVTYQDGYFIFNRADTGQFFISELLSTDFDPLDYATAEGAPDDTLAVISDHRELWVFGAETIEVWYNSGDADFPFERMQGAFIERGIGALASVAKQDNSVFWLGDDGVIYRANGYIPQRVSTFAIENDIGKGEISDAFSYTYTEEGHKFYVITFPAQEKTWCLDISIGLWHERSHIQWGRHHSSCYSRCYGIHFVGDFQNGMIYMLDNAALSDVGEDIRRLAVSPPLHFNRRRATMNSIELDMEMGGAAPGDNPQAMLRWSDDGGNNYSNEYWVSMGETGEYSARAKWNRLGEFRQRQLELSITGKVFVSIIESFAEVSIGRN